jgi:hypothetical protein
VPAAPRVGGSGSPWAPRPRTRPHRLTVGETRGSWGAVGLRPRSYVPPEGLGAMVARSQGLFFFFLTYLMRLKNDSTNKTEPKANYTSRDFSLKIFEQYL